MDIKNLFNQDWYTIQIKRRTGFKVSFAKKDCRTLILYPWNGKLSRTFKDYLDEELSSVSVNSKKL